MYLKILSEDFRNISPDETSLVLCCVVSYLFLHEASFLLSKRQPLYIPPHSLPAVITFSMQALYRGLFLKEDRNRLNAKNRTIATTHGQSCFYIGPKDLSEAVETHSGECAVLSTRVDGKRPFL